MCAVTETLSSHIGSSVRVDCSPFVFSEEFVAQISCNSSGFCFVYSDVWFVHLPVNGLCRSLVSQPLTAICESSFRTNVHWLEYSSVGIADRLGCIIAVSTYLLVPPTLQILTMCLPKTVFGTNEKFMKFVRLPPILTVCRNLTSQDAFVMFFGAQVSGSERYILASNLGPILSPKLCVFNARWFKYDRDKLWLVYTQSIQVLFEPLCNIIPPPAPTARLGPGPGHFWGF